MTTASPPSRPRPRPAPGAREAALLLTAALVGSALLSSLLPGRAGAQEPRAGRTAFPFRAPLVSPLEPATRLAPVHVERGARSRWVGLVDLGDSFPFWLHGGSARPGAFRLAAALAGSAASRFDLESNGNEFIEAHFRVGLRLRARLGALDGRLELYHVSSHLGDEFLERTGRSPISTSREGLEALLQGRPLPGLAVYGGPGLVLRSTEGLDAPSLRLGADWRARVARWGPFRPYAGLELYAWDELDWDPMLSAESGVEFAGGRYRLGLIAGAGPARAEQFFREDETLLGLVFTARP